MDVPSEAALKAATNTLRVNRVNLDTQYNMSIDVNTKHGYCKVDLYNIDKNRDQWDNAATYQESCLNGQSASEGMVIPNPALQPGK